MKEDHIKLLRQEDSPRLKYIEDFYLRKLRSGERSYTAIVRRIKRIRRSSLKPEEKKHILKHLAMHYIAEDLRKVPPVIRSHKIKRKGREYTIYRNPSGRFVKNPKQAVTS